MYDRRTLTKGMAASFGVVFLVVMLVVSSGVAFSLPLGGIGGFIIKADRIEGDDLVYYTGVTDTSEKEGIPTAVTEFTEVRIDGLRLIKQFESVPVIGGNARIVITSTGTVVADTMLIKQTYIYAEDSTFNGLLIDEQPASDISKRFQQIAPSTEADRHRGADRFTDPVSINITTQENPGQVFVNTTIQAHYQAVNQIHIPGLTLAVEYDANGDGDYTDERDITVGS